MKRPTIKTIIANNTRIREAPLSHVFLPISTKATKIANNINMTADNITFADFIFPPLIPDFISLYSKTMNKSTTENEVSTMYYTQEQINRANQADIISFLQSQGNQLTRTGNEYNWKRNSYYRFISKQ